MISLHVVGAMVILMVACPWRSGARGLLMMALIAKVMDLVFGDLVNHFVDTIVETGRATCPDIVSLLIC